MKKFHHSDWLRAVQKRGNKPSVLIGQWSKKHRLSIKSFDFKSSARPEWCNFSTLRDTHAFLLLKHLGGSCNFVSLWKIYSCLFIPNCTRNRVITYTNKFLPTQTCFACLSTGNTLLTLDKHWLQLFNSVQSVNKTTDSRDWQHQRVPVIFSRVEFFKIVQRVIPKTKRKGIKEDFRSLHFI